MFSKKYKKILIVEGMHCNHCAATVEKALKELEGLSKVKVHLDKKEVEVISTTPITEESIKKVFANLDFELKEIKG